MSERLQKKCVIASAGLHLTLLIVFLFGSAFLGADKKADDMQILEFVPMITTDAIASGGGNPNAKPPPSTPAPPQPQPPPAPAAAQPPQREEKVEPPKSKPDKVDPDSLETKTDKKPHKVVPNLKVQVRKPTTKPTTSSSADAEAQAQAQAKADAKARAERFSSAARSLKDNLSSGTSVEMPGPGGGGPTYANYKQVVGSIYFHAWIVPDDVESDAATGVASVTIARDGTVVSATLTRSSGNKSVDRSIQATLDRVRYIAPFPADSKDSQRTFTVNFNLKAKKAIG